MKYKYLPESEAELQEKCEQYLHIQGLTFIHIPDQLFKFLYSTNLAMALYRKQGMYKWLQMVRKLNGKHLLGFPDLVIFKENRYLAIELKSKKGKMRQGQKKMQKKINTKIVRDFSTFKQLVDEFDGCNNS